MKKSSLRLLLTFILLQFGVVIYAQENNKSIEYGAFLLESNKLSEAESTFQGCLESSATVKEKFDRYYSIAILYNTNLYFDLSIEYCKEAISISDVSKSNSRRFLHLIAINHLDLNNLDQAEKYYWMADEFKSTLKKEIANDLNLIGEIKRFKHEYDIAINHLKEAIEINQSIGNYTDLAMNYNNLGLVYLEKEEFSKAESHLNTSLKIIDSLDLISRRVAIDISFGRLNQSQGNYKIAIEYFAKIIKSELNFHSDKTELLRDANKGLYECFDKLDESKSALLHYKEYQKFNQMIFDREKQAAIFESQILFEKDAHKQEIDLFQQKVEIEKKYNRIYLILLCIGIILLSLFVVLLRLRNKSMKQKVELIERNSRIQQLEIENSKAMNEKLQGEIREKEQSRKIEDLELQKLKDTIDFKNRELTSSAVHLANKNEILSEIDSKIKSLDNWEGHSKLKELNIIIKQNLQLDKDWDIFKKHFIEVHPAFFKAIVYKYPDLTNDDLKLCAYLKLQLSSKEIARLLNIETTAVNKRRNRIRKKLNIESSVDLHEFMITVDKK